MKKLRKSMICRIEEDNLSVLVQRFMDQVEKLSDDPDSCWMWTGTRTPDDYGMFYFNRKQTTAHRFAYLVFVGPLPEGYVPDHLCRNHWCVNPRHLEPVTSRENTLRGNSVMAQKARWTHCQNGHEFTNENTGRDSRGNRYCKLCRRDRTRVHMNKSQKREASEPSIGQVWIALGA